MKEQKDLEQRAVEFNNNAECFQIAVPSTERHFADCATTVSSQQEAESYLGLGPTCTARRSSSR